MVNRDKNQEIHGNDISVNGIEPLDYKTLSTNDGYEEPYSKVGMFFFQTDAKSKFILYNTTAQETLGYDESELIGKNFLIFFDESHRARAREVIDICLRRGYIKDIEILMRRKEGHHCWVKLSGLTTFDDTGNPRTVRFYSQNISELVRTKKQRDFILRMVSLSEVKSQGNNYIQELLRELQEAMSYDELEISFTENDAYPNFHLSHLVKESLFRKHEFSKWTPEIWNRLLIQCQDTEGCHLTSQGSLYISSISELIHGIQAGVVRDCLVLLAEYESMIVVPFLKESGNTAYLIVLHGVPGFWDGWDIDFLETVVLHFIHPQEEKHGDTTPIPDQNQVIMDIPFLGILSVKHGMIQSVNSWIITFLCVPREQILGRDFLDFIDPEYKDMVSSMQKRGGTGEASYPQCEVQVVNNEGKRRWIECTFIQKSMKGKSEGVWYWINKEDKQQLKYQLLQARKMESLGLLVGGIVDDFNNLMACILGYSSLLSEEIPSESSHYEDIQQINRTAERAAELTSRLMAHSQGGEYVVNNLNVNQLIKEVAAILSRTLNKRISIKAELEQEIWLLKADASQIQQAILQVALNARDAMMEGGKIIFQTRNIVLEENDTRLHPGRKSGRYVQISINDTGKGMSGHVKERIFEPYFTTRNKNTGKGLGLSMVREIVENHSGFVSVFSEKDKGTVFKIYLYVNGENHSKSSFHSGGKIALGKETILLVDDERVLRETARKMLTRYGYKVMSAENGIEAVAMYKKYLNKIDLVILDLVMPGTEIGKILSWLKRLNPKAKIVAASELGQVGAVNDEFEPIISGYIQKPFQVRPLLRTVRSVLNA